MVRKTKLAKTRLDKYYNLAKEQGYRARSAYKLIQISKKYNIFKDCNVLIDLCAAPGGWLQVASNALPINSLIIGVDLVPIKPIKNVVTLQMDITSQHTKQVLLKHVKGSKVDVVLHDGSPNMGSNWNLDAFNQNQLVLSATSLACNLLKKGGVFVTKVFRSSEYSSLIWVFQELFHVVKATKPQSSRSVSAEIFVVCMNYKSPQFLDPKLFDIKHVFKNRGSNPVQVEEESSKSKSLSHLLKLRKQNKRQGYSKGDDYRDCLILDYLKTDNPSDILVNYNRIKFDKSDVSEIVKNHPLTTEEILTLVDDLQVLGKKDLLLLLKWRMKLLKCITKNGVVPELAKVHIQDLDKESELVQNGTNGIDSDIQSISLRDRLSKSVKKRQKKFLENLGKESQVPQLGDPELFSNTIESQLLLESGSDLESLVTEEDIQDLPGETYIPFDGENSYGAIEEELEHDYVIQKERARIRSEKAAKRAKRREIIQEERVREMEQTVQRLDKNYINEDGSVSDSDQDYDTDKSLPNDVDRWFSQDVFKIPDVDDKIDTNNDKNGTKIVQNGDLQNGTKKLSNGTNLDSDQIQLYGPLLVSKRSRLDLMDGLYNRYTFHEEADELPLWFREDEDAHTKVELPLTKEQMRIYRMKLKEIKSMPIKKVREAVSRRMKKVKSKLDKVRSETENISNRNDVSVIDQIKKNKKILKKVTKDAKGKKNKVYVVSNKIGSSGKGKSGEVVKVVDRRMKKDNWKAKKNMKNKNGRRKNKGNRRR